MATLERLETGPSFRIDARTTQPDRLRLHNGVDWSGLRWERLGKPYLVDNYSRQRGNWEREHGHAMPVPVQWEHFNRRFHELFTSDLKQRRKELAGQGLKRLLRLDLPGAAEIVEDLAQNELWNYVHRVEDAVWDPRGKRALFGGLDLVKPRILFLGAADGYEAMQLQALYPGGTSVLVDYDAFCRDERFGNFPERYPFLGNDPSTGGWKTYHRPDFDIEFVVEDIRKLQFGPEFDVVLSVGLVEHFPDDYKPQVFDFHRRFLKPGGYAIMTTPRREVRSKLFYRVMGELMNYGYRELMDELQLGLYAYENGFDIVRCGSIKAHNCIVARSR